MLILSLSFVARINMRISRLQRVKNPADVLSDTFFLVQKFQFVVGSTPIP